VGFTATLRGKRKKKKEVRRYSEKATPPIITTRKRKKREGATVSPPEGTLQHPLPYLTSNKGKKKVNKAVDTERPNARWQRGRERKKKRHSYRELQPERKKLKASFHNKRVEKRRNIKPQRGLRTSSSTFQEGRKKKGKKKDATLTVMRLLHFKGMVPGLR